MATRILFVCSGNAARSPMAAALCAALARERGRSDVETASAGVTAREGAPVSPEAIAALAELGIELERRRTRRLSAKLLHTADLIVSMTTQQRDQIVRRFPTVRLRTVPLMSFVEGGDTQVADPHGGDLEAYRACLRQLRPALEALLEAQERS